jgi:manganese transport protein
MEQTSQVAAPTANGRIRFKWLPAFRGGQVWSYFGPAFVASVAYIDPGNFATNIQGGTEFGYTLLWVLLWSNAMAILVQYLSAKLGIATGRTLPQNCRQEFSRTVNFGLWIAAELAAVATDLAEFLGAVLGFYLLLHIPLLISALLTGVIVFLILATELYGFRRLEQVIMGFVVGIGACYGIEIFLAKPQWGEVFHYVFIPHLSTGSVYIAVGMLGATVMPHVVYLHSALVQARLKEDSFNCPTGQWLAKLRHAHYELIDVLAAMNGAWLVNSAMIIMAAAVFAHAGRPVASIEQAHETLKPLLGNLSATAFALALLFSGLSSSTVGTMAGQVILEGFLNVRMSIFLRRFLTMLPAIAVIAIGLDPLKILVLSQVVLSFALPFALIPLILLTRRADLMGDLVNGLQTNWLAYLTVAVILGLNGLLLYQTFGGTF